jgi:dihydrofolate synthase/folylpolyglutamate synthase
MLILTSLSDAPQQLEAYWPTKRIKHRATLDHMYELMAYLGNPQDKVKVIHVAGTSGKTSTVYYAAALLQAAGKRVGMAVSPHVDLLNERVQIDMIPLPEAIFCDELNTFMALVEQGGFTMTYFEILYAFAYWEFVRQQVEYAVVEVGIGGLLDTTNVVSRPDKVCVLTDIGMDHMSILGNTLPEIAAQKAGIIKLHNKVFCWQQPDDVLREFKRVAHQQQADIDILHGAALGKNLSFLPAFQRRNFELALRAVEYALQRDGGALEMPAIQRAAHTCVPARMEVFKRGRKTIIIDGSHNQQKLHALMTAVVGQYPGQAVIAVVAFTRSPRPEARIESGIQELIVGASRLILTTFTVNRTTPHPSLDPTVAAAICDAAGYTAYDIVVDPAAAFAAALARPEPIVVVAGSFFLLNHIRPLLK